MSKPEPPIISAHYTSNDGRAIPATKYPRTFRIFGMVFTDYGPPKITAGFIIERFIIVSVVIGGMLLLKGAWSPDQLKTGFPPELRPGDVMSGHVFVGADPTNPAAWHKLPPPLDQAALDDIRRKYGNH